MTKIRKKHWLLRIWIKVRGLIALTIVMAGICVGLLSLLLPFESLYQDYLEDFLEEQWGIAVKVSEIEGSWRGYGPYFALKNLSLSGTQSVDLEAASLSINVYQMMLPGGRTGIDLSINKAELGMIQSSQGPSITINDQRDEARFTDMLDRILTTGSLRVDELTVNLANQKGEVMLTGLKAGFLLEQDKENRAFKLSINSNKKDQSIEIKSIGGRNDSLTKDAQWHIAFNQFELSQLNELLNDYQLPEGHLDGQLWMNASDGVVSTAYANLNWVDAINGYSFNLQIKHQGNQKEWQSLWQFEQKSADSTTQKFTIQLQRQNDISELVSDQLPVPILTHLLVGVTQPLGPFEQLVKNLTGEVKDLAITYNHQTGRIQQGGLKFNGWASSDELVDFSGISGQLNYDNNQAKLWLHSDAGHLTAPELYRGKLKWSQMSAQIDYDFTQPIGQIMVNTLWCECGDFNLELWLQLKLSEIKHMILTSKISQLDIAQSWKYWPYQIWKEKTINWLDDSLISGEVTQGYVFVHGDMVEQGFKKGDAEFSSRAYINDTTNRFRPEWPAVSELKAVAEFTHDQAFVDVAHALTSGIHITEADINIASLDVGLIAVNLTAEAKDNEILNYLNQSPLSKNIILSDQITLTGSQDVQLDFNVSLKADQKQTFMPTGLLRFDNGSFTTEFFDLERINGTLLINGYDLIIEDLPAQLESSPVTLNGKIVTQSEQGLTIDVDIQGLLNAQLLLDKINQVLPVSGDSTWLINIKNMGEQLMMEARSDLAGVVSELPAPLNKTADELKNISIVCNIPCAQSTVKLNYAEQIKSVIDTQNGTYHLSQLKFIDPKSNNQSINPFGGYIENLNLDQWLSLIASRNIANTENQLPTENIELSIGQLVFMSRQFDAINLNISRLSNSYEIVIDSKDIKGVVRLADDLDDKGIVAEFSDLNWIDASESESQEQRLNKTNVPDIHLYAEHFKDLTNLKVFNNKMEFVEF